MAPTDTSALAMNLPRNIAVFLIGFGNRKYPVFDSYSDTIASAPKNVALSMERMPRNESTFTVNCFGSLGYWEPIAGGTIRKMALMIIVSRTIASNRRPRRYFKSSYFATVAICRTLFGAMATPPPQARVADRLLLWPRAAACRKRL